MRIHHQACSGSLVYKWLAQSFSLSLFVTEFLTAQTICKQHKMFQKQSLQEGRPRCLADYEDDTEEKEQ